MDRIATISHELRAPLAAIMGYTDLMLEGIAGEINEEQRSFLEAILRQCKQLLGLVTSILEMGRLERLELSPEQVDMAHVITRAVETVAPLARERGVSISSSGRAEVAGDLDLLTQVLVNLIDNALRHSRAGTAVTIEVQPGAEVTVKVSDAGPGVPHRLKERIFEEFHRIDHEGSGAGLGLAVVRTIVAAHRGTVAVQDNDPFGSVFVVRLPGWVSVDD